MKKNKIIKSRLKKNCACCDKDIIILLYDDRSYRGGHYFGKIIESKVKKSVEYWECPKCYWGR